jgi:uncharacterized protein YdeI (YjbR/CyaY-like superfamily)
MNSKVTTYLNKPSQWKSAMIALRTLLLEAGLEESLKWGKPCYAYNDKNVVIIQAFKEHCDLGFFNGALLKDEKKLLIKAGVNTQAGRQLRFTNVQEIEQAKPIIKAYLKEAIANEKSGKKFVAETNSEKMIVEELDAIFAKNKTLKKAFEALTPGRQRAYLLFFAAAKQSATRIKRIESYSAKIMCGKGMNDCTCGLSKRMPNCDGSHKYLKV